ncbi:CRPV-367 [Crowpox virus]|nr:CRPV-367 [Crowpox virus]
MDMLLCVQASISIFNVCILLFIDTCNGVILSLFLMLKIAPFSSSIFVRLKLLCFTAK